MRITHAMPLYTVAQYGIYKYLAILMNSNWIKKKALQITKYFRHKKHDYNYLQAVFVHLKKRMRGKS